MSSDNGIPIVTFTSPARARAISHSENKSQNEDSRSIELSPSETKRHHSSSITSVSSQMSDDFEPYSKKHSFDAEPIDLEKQLIISAGGRNVCCFLLKALLLTTVVLGCGVLVFYAL